MNRPQPYLLKFTALCALAMVTCLLCGCQGIRPYRQTSFDNVTRRLDRGGNFYLYMDTEQIGQKAEESIDFFHHSISETSDLDPEERDNAKAVADWMKKILRESGLKQLCGLGLSSVAIDEALYHNKLFLCRDQALQKQSEAELWQMFGDHPHRLTALEMLPDNTVFATFMDVNTRVMADWLNRMVEESDIAEVKKEYRSFKKEFCESSNVSIGSLLNTFDHQAGMFLTFDSKETNVIPFDGQLIRIPEPSLTLVLKVRNKDIFDYIFRELHSRFPHLQSYVNNGMSIINIPLPPLPMLIQPVIAQKDGFLVISNNLAAANAFLDQDKAKKLVNSDEFIRIARHIPLEGNGFKFVSDRISKTMQDVQNQLVKNNKQYSAEEAGIFKRFDLFKKGFCLFAIYRVEQDGIMAQFNTNLSISQLIILQGSILPTIIASKILFPDDEELDDDDGDVEEEKESTTKKGMTAKSGKEPGQSRQQQPKH